MAFVCGQYGYSNDSDGFSSITVDSQDQKNSVFDSSVSHCEARLSHTMYHQLGHAYIKSVNLSHNKVKDRSALEILSSDNKNKIESDIIYCSFSNNTATIQYCIFLGSGSEIKNSNIILNNGKDVILTERETKLISCCVMDNKDKPVFVGSISLYECSVGEDQYEESNVDQEFVGTNTFIHGLTFLSTGFCYSSFDVLDSLTPSSPIQKKTRICQCSENPHNYFPISYHTLHCMFFIICINSLQ